MKSKIFIYSVVLLVLLISAVSAEESIVTCSNDKYSTETQDLPTDPTSWGVALTDESQNKLKDSVELEGDSALQEINSLDCLEYLNLNDFAISDLSSIENLVNLQRLYLSNTNVSDLSPLSNFVNLKHLVLYSDTKEAKFSDLSPLSDLENLEILLINLEAVSDITPLQNLVNLNTLEIKNYRDEHDISKLKGLNLKELEISRPSIVNDASSFTELINVKKLSFTDVNVDCDFLRQALPRVDVNCFYSVPDSSEPKLPENQELIKDNGLNLAYWIIGVVIIVGLIIFLILRRKK